MVAPDRYGQVQRDQTVFIFGAGASAACGTPLTNEILWRAFTEESVYAELCRNGERAVDVKCVGDCLKEHFHVPEEGAQKEDFPSLTLLLSILDISIDRNRPFPPSDTFPNGLSREDLAKARGSLEYIVFGVLDHYLKNAAGNAQRDLLQSSLVAEKEGPQVISLNYDIIADAAMCQIAQDRKGSLGRLDYACDVNTDVYLRTKTGEFRVPYGKLLKLHGSLNWLFCPGCQALQIGMSASGTAIADSSMMRALYEYRSLDKHYLCSEFGCKACLCVYCQTPLRPVMITPSFAKDYRNPHIQKVWYEAERLLRRCEQAYFIGYSLPDDDIEVVHLLRRGLEGLPASQITVVAGTDDPAMHRRYVSLFGKVDWQPGGFEPWLKRKHLPRSSAAVA